MTRHTKLRRHHAANPTSWAQTILSSQPMQPGHATDILLKLRTAFDRMKTGEGADTDFDELAAAFNVGTIRAEAIDPLVVQAMVAGQHALMAADAINGTHGRYGFHGPDLQAMNEALDAYEEILRNSSPNQMNQALQESVKRMRAGQVMQAPEGPQHEGART